MATQQQTSRNGGAPRIQYKPVKSTSETRPPVPAGKWKAVIPKDRFKIGATKEQDPMLSIPIKFVEAEEEANESFQGAEEMLRIVFYADDNGEKTKAANMSKIRLRALCEAVEVDYDEVYPTSIESDEDFQPLIKALGGKTIEQVWTVHRPGTMPSGETTTNVDILFKEPNSFGRASNKDEEEDDEEERGSRKKANGNRRR